MTDTSKIAAKLQARIEELKAEIAELDAKTTKRLPTRSSEQANPLTELARNEALEAQHGAEIAQIQRALGQIKAGTYGICEACGDKIAPARLEALPDATKCIKCA